MASYIYLVEKRLRHGDSVIGCQPGESNSLCCRDAAKTPIMKVLPAKAKALNKSFPWDSVYNFCVWVWCSHAPLIMPKLEKANSFLPITQKLVDTFFRRR